MKLEDVLHFYIGCDIWSEYNNRAEKLIGVERSVDGETIVATHYKVRYRYDISEIKPILRPLSDMTEDEINYGVSTWGEDFVDYYNGVGEGMRFCEGLPVKDAVVFFMWLLSKRFDLFSLIESSQAIDATKIKPA